VTEVELLVGLLAFVRLVTLVALIAPLAGGPVPAPVKIGLGAALTLAWLPGSLDASVPSVSAAIASPQPGPYICWLVIREVLTGVAVAWVLSLLFVPIRIAGAYIGQEIGLTLGGLTSPIDQHQSSVVTQVLEPLATIALFATNAHHLLLRALHRSLDLFPLGGAGATPDSGWITRCVAGAERAGFELAAPIGAGLFIILACTLLMMRLVPQFNFQTFGSPLRLAAGMLLLVALWPDMLGRITILLGRLGTL
jgi:flagellar biosynthetic protein FliR